MIDNHETMRPYGVVQLFVVPHPIKIEKNEKIEVNLKKPLRNRTENYVS